MPPRPPRPALLSQTIMIAAAAPMPAATYPADQRGRSNKSRSTAASGRAPEAGARPMAAGHWVGVRWRDGESRLVCVGNVSKPFVQPGADRPARHGAEAANARSNRDRRGGTWLTGGRCPVRRTPTEILVSPLRRRRPWLSGVSGRYRPPLDTKNKEKSL